MSRNGSGVYSLPAGNPVITGTVISSSWANTTLSDIATALTGSISADGQTPITANIPFSGYKITGLANGTAATDGMALGQLQTITSINGGQLAGFRNSIINGDFRVAQRAAGTVSNGYSIDRWYQFCTGTALAWSQNVASFDGSTVSSILVITGAGGNASVNVAQRIEMLNSRHLAGKTVTVSYMVYQTTGATVSCSTQFNACAAENVFPAADLIGTTSGVSCPTGTWTRVTGSIAIPVGTQYGLQVLLWAQNTAILAGKELWITNVQLEIGSVATPFEQRPYSVELSLCQHYAYTGPITARGVVTSGTTSDRLAQIHPVPMYAAPTVTMTSACQIYDGLAAVTAATVSANNSTAASLDISFTHGAGLTATLPALVIPNGSFLVSAEL